MKKYEDWMDGDEEGEEKDDVGGFFAPTRFEGAKG